jgi:hypothetical protein
LAPPVGPDNSGRIRRSPKERPAASSNAGGARGELIARVAADSNGRIGSVRKPYEGASPCPGGLARWTEEAKQRPIETLGRRLADVSLSDKARERRSGANPDQGVCGRPWKGQAHGSIQRSVC